LFSESATKYRRAERHHKKEKEASESSHPISHLAKVSTLFRKSNILNEQLGLSSFCFPPLSSSSPTFVSEGKEIEYKRKQIKQLDTSRGILLNCY
jgi:hypothetical protein